jgi:hypothetical protein
MPTAVRARGRDGGCTSSAGAWVLARSCGCAAADLAASQSTSAPGTRGLPWASTLNVQQPGALEGALAICIRGMEPRSFASQRPLRTPRTRRRWRQQQPAIISVRCARAAGTCGHVRPSRQAAHGRRAPIPVRVPCPGTGHEHSFRRPPRSQADGRCRAVGSVAFFAGRRPHSTNLRRCQFRVLFASR